MAKKAPIRLDGVAKQGQKTAAKKAPVKSKRKATAKKKKKKAGNPNLIRTILKVAKEYEKIPLRNYRVLGALVPCSARCLEMHWSQGKDDAESGKTRTLDFRFFRIIEQSRSMAHLEAVEKIKEQIKKDPTAATAFKYLAITDREHWAETQKHEVTAQVAAVSQMSLIDQADELAAERRKRREKAKK